MKNVFKKRKERRNKNRERREQKRIMGKYLHDGKMYKFKNVNFTPITIDVHGNVSRLINKTGVVGSAEKEMFGCEIERDLPEYIRSFADKMGITNISDPHFVLHVQHLFFHDTKRS